MGLDNGAPKWVLFAVAQPVALSDTLYHAAPTAVKLVLRVILKAPLFFEALRNRL